MCTGDNIYTSIATGYKAGIIQKDEILFICRLNEDRDKIEWESKDQNTHNLNSQSNFPWQALQEQDPEQKFSFAITGDAYDFLDKDKVL